MATMTELFGPPGPGRRARMLAKGLNPGPTDFTDEERAAMPAAPTEFDSTPEQS